MILLNGSAFPMDTSTPNKHVHIFIYVLDECQINLLRSSSGGSPSEKLFSSCNFHPTNADVHPQSQYPPSIFSLHSALTFPIRLLLSPLHLWKFVSSLYPQCMTSSKYLMGGRSSAIETLPIFRAADWIRLALLSIRQPYKVSKSHNYFLLDTKKQCLIYNKSKLFNEILNTHEKY